MRTTLFALVVLASACSKKPGGPSAPTCSQVTDHVLEIMKGGLTNHGGLEMGNHKQLVDQCEARKLSPAQRTCMVAAKDVTSLAACSSAPPAAVPTAPAGPVTAPTGSGS